MSIGAWFVFSFVSAIPVVGFIMWLVLLFGENTNTSLKNLLILQLIELAILIVIVIVFWGVIFASFANA